MAEVPKHRTALLSGIVVCGKGTVFMGFKDLTQFDMCHWLTRAEQLFAQHDLYLLKNDVNERSMTHRFAVHLEVTRPDRLDEDCAIDCEYNRKKGVPKLVYTLYHKELISPCSTSARTVYPDIIVHRRGTTDNLMVIEAKKRCVKDSLDLSKLKAYRREKGLRYQFAVMLTFDTSSRCSVTHRFIDG